MLIKPDPNYRPNPGRAVYVTGVINDDLLAQLTPTLLALQAQNREPITVYIDSPGGQTSVLTNLLHMLRLPDQDASPPCRIITVVTVRAASAAADLLCSGDYATALSTSIIHYHGNRMRWDRPLTLEDTSILSGHIRDQNAQFAIDLAGKIESRFLFRFISLRGRFADYRSKQGTATLSDLDCFIGLVGEELSPNAWEFWDRAQQRRGRYEDLSNFVSNKIFRYVGKATLAQYEAHMLKAIVDFQLSQNKSKATWSFKRGGLVRVVDDFFLYNEFMASYNTRRLEVWSSTFASIVLPPQKMAEFEAIVDDAERAKATYEAVWISIRPTVSFFLALCHALQEGENRFTAQDAYWLGLIDEVIGADLLSRRNVAEHLSIRPRRKRRPTTSRRSKRKILAKKTSR